MRGAAALAAVGLCSCSWLFQTPLKSKKDGGYDGTSEPRCDDGSGLAIVDLVIGALSFAAIAADSSGGALAGDILIGTLFTGSMLSGFSWSHECENAYVDWRERKAERKRERQREAADEEHEVARRERERLKSVDVHEIELRGFFCASSPGNTDASVCDRKKTACAAARDALAVAVTDITQCTLVETAWCFAVEVGGSNGRCAVSEASCNAQRVAAGGDVGDCVEQH
jgi:hypothetical protein